MVKHARADYVKEVREIRKNDDLVQKVQLIEANPMYAKIRYLDGRESNVSLKDLARYPGDRTNTFNEGNIEPLEEFSHGEIAHSESDLLQNSQDNNNNQEGNIESFNLSDNCDDFVDETDEIVLNDNEKSYENFIPSTTYVNRSNSPNIDTSQRSSRINKGAPPHVMVRLIPTELK